MRTRLTAKPWFGPKRYLGWGWTPVAWQGWLTTGILILLLIASDLIWTGTSAVVAIVVLVVLHLCVVVLTGDPPGGPG